MNYIDIVIGLLLFASLVIGWRQGFIRQLFGLLALFLGVYCAYKFSGITAHYLSRWFEINESITKEVSFAVTFLVVLIFVIIVGRFADRIVRMVALGFLNRFLGMILSLFKAVLIISICLLILKMFDILPAADTQKSFLYQPLENIATNVFPYLKKLYDFSMSLF